MFMNQLFHTGLSRDRQFRLGELADFSALFYTVDNGRAVVDASIHAADRSFVGGMSEGAERARGQSKFVFGIVVEGEVVSEKCGEDDGCGGTGHAVPAGVFGERRRLQQGQPVFV